MNDVEHGLGIRPSKNVLLLVVVVRNASLIHSLRFIYKRVIEKQVDRVFKYKFSVVIITTATPPQVFSSSSASVAKSSSSSSRPLIGSIIE